MMRLLIFTVFGYLCGSVLFARVFARLFRRGDILAPSKDGNPGVANAFLYGGFWCGVCTLLGDVLKGFVPVFLLTLGVPAQTLDWRYVFFRFRGGKGIAVTFGCLLGLFPYTLPFTLFAASFIFFSVVLKVSPHFYRTIFAYIATLALLPLLRIADGVCVAFLIISATVCLKLHMSKEEREKITVKLTWKR